MSDGSARILKHLGRMVRSEVETAASPWQAWLAWTDLAHLSNWLIDSSRGEIGVGKRLRWTLWGTRRSIELEICRLEDGRSIVAQLHPSGQLIEISIEGSSGGSLVSITHSGFADNDLGDSAYSEAVADWQLRVKVLKLYLNDYFGRSRRSLRLQQMAKAPSDEVRRFLLNPSGHHHWLTLDGELAPLREQRLVLWDGTEIHSDTLMVALNSLMFTWDEGDGFVLLSCHERGGQSSEVWIDISCWGENPEGLETFGETLRVGLSKLVRSFEDAVRSNSSRD